MDVATEYFHSVMLPFLYHTIDEKQLRSTSFSDSFDRDPGHAVFVREVKWELLGFEGSGASQEQAHQAGLKDLINLLSTFSALQHLIIVTDGLFLHLPTQDQLAVFQPRQMHSLSLSFANAQGLLGLQVDASLWSLLHRLANISGVSNLAFLGCISFQQYPPWANIWSSVRNIDIQFPYPEPQSDSRLGKLLADCPAIEEVVFSCGHDPSGLASFLDSLPEVLSGRRLLRLGMTDIMLNPDAASLPIIGKVLPQLQQLSLSFDVSDTNTLDMLSRTLEALFPSTRPCQNLTHLALSCSDTFETLFGSEDLSHKIFACLTRSSFPVLQFFRFKCCKDAERYFADGNGEEAAVRRCADGDYEADLKRLVAIVPDGLEVTYGYLDGSVGPIKSFVGSREKAIEVRYW